MRRSSRIESKRVEGGSISSEFNVIVVAWAIGYCPAQMESHNEFDEGNKDANKRADEEQRSDSQ